MGLRGPASALYGADASNPEWVDDLRKRSAQFDAKLHAPPKREPARTQTQVKVATSEVETLTCAQCGRQWERPRTRGRKPQLCDTCRAAAQDLDRRNHAADEDKTRHD